MLSLTNKILTSKSQFFQNIVPRLIERKSISRINCWRCIYTSKRDYRTKVPPAKCLSLISTDKYSFVLCLFVLNYFTVEKNFFLCLHNLWILFFRMMYNSYICSLILTEKSAVYDEGLPLLLLDDMSSISTLSIIIVPINDIPARYMRKRTSQERKTFFTSFARR